MKELKTGKKRLVEDSEDEVTTKTTKTNSTSNSDTKQNKEFSSTLKKKKKRKVEAREGTTPPIELEGNSNPSSSSSSEEESIKFYSKKIKQQQQQQQQLVPVKKKKTLLPPPSTTSSKPPTINKTRKPTRPPTTSRPSLPSIKTTTATSPLPARKSTNSATSASTSSRRSPPPPPPRLATKAGSSASSYKTYTSVAGTTSIPFRVTGKGFVDDILPHASLGLSFDNQVIENSTAKRKGKDKSLNVGAKIDSLADATSFIAFAFARGVLTNWTGIQIEEELNVKGTEITVKLFLIDNGGGKKLKRKLELVQVKASCEGLGEEARNKTQQETQLCAKFEFIRAIISPSTRPREFIKEIYKDLETYIFDSAFDSAEEDSHGRRMDLKGKELFYEYRRLHPRLALGKLERDFKNVGSLEFQDKCRDLISLFEKATTRVDTSFESEVKEEGEGENKGFGSWEGEVQTSLSKILGAIEASCLKDPGYYPISVTTMSILRQICEASNGGERALESLTFWYKKCDTANLLIDQQCLKAGIVRKMPIVLQPDTRKLVTRVVVLPEKKVMVVEKQRETDTIGKEAIVNPYAAIQPRQDTGPTVDPRRRRVSLDQLASTTTFTTTTSSIFLPSPSFVSSPIAILPKVLPTPTPISDAEWQIREAERRANLKKYNLSRNSLRDSSILPSILELGIGSVGISMDSSQQGPTPEATPEAIESSEGSGLEYLECYSALSETVEIMREKRMTRLSFVIGNQNLINKLSGKIEGDDHLHILELPYRAFAVFRSPSEMEGSWPSVQLSVNSNEQTCACFPPDTPITSFQKTAIPSKYMTLGENKISFVKWSNQILPVGMNLSIELYIAYSAKWLYSQVQMETEDRDYNLYLTHSKLVPSVPLSFHDPTTGDRMITAVRGKDCNHLETFDLDSYVRRNLIESEWICPLCEISVTPTSLRICGWTKTVLENELYDVHQSIVIPPPADQDMEE